MKTVAFVPMKLHNERLPGKNTRLLGGVKPLFELILESLLAASGIDEVYIFCSESNFPHHHRGVKYLRRDTSLDQPSTRINEVMRSFADQVPADIYVLAHATAPFLSPQTITTLVSKVQSGEHDSALSVTALREFLWADGRPANYDPTSIPRTQDISPMFVETSGAYAYTRDVLERSRRVGDRPALVEVSKIEALDINDVDDWLLADAVFRQTRVAV